MSWTDERISTLKKMWQQGKSASEIAEKLGGVTRNAVIGKAHRLGLSGRPSPIKAVASGAAKKPVAAAVSKKEVAAPLKKEAVKAVAPVVKKPEAVAVKVAASTTALKPIAPPVKAIANSPGKPAEPIILAAMANATSRSDGKILSILELNERMCRWPVGDPKEAGFGYCGGVQITGHPYCAEHVAIAFQAPNRKDGKKAHKDVKSAEAPELEDLEV